MCNPSWLALAFLVLIPTADVPERPVRVSDLTGNVEARLVGSKRHQGSGGWLMAKLETLDADRKEIVLLFPAHSFTTHERTLKEIIQGCTVGQQADRDGWHKVKDGIEAVFFVPKDGIGASGNKSLDHCCLTKLSVNAAK
jgi:hypothetical protein